MMDRVGYLLRCIWTEITTDGHRCARPGCGRPAEYKPALCWRHFDPANNSWLLARYLFKL